MITEGSIEIEAPASVVWDVFTDVERWSEWTASMTGSSPSTGRGSRWASGSRSSSRGCPSSSGRSPRSSRASRGRGARGRPAARRSRRTKSTAIDAERTLVRQRIDQRGPVGVAVGVLMRRLTKRYLDLEAQGLKAFASEHFAMPRPPDEQRRSELLDALIDAFADGGIGGRSLREVAEAVGTSHRMLLHYFGSRDELLLAIVEEVERRQTAQLESLPRRPGRRDRGDVGRPAPAGAATLRATVLRVLRARPPRARRRLRDAPGAVDGWLDEIASEATAGSTRHWYG